MRFNRVLLALFLLTICVGGCSTSGSDWLWGNSAPQAAEQAPNNN